MYLQFYDLDRAPFQSSFDPDFFWQGTKIHKLLKILKFDFERHTRISLITGDPGCGKTSVIRAALDSLNPSVLVAVVPDSRLSVREFYDLTGHALGLPGPFPTRKTFLKQILALLQSTEEQKKQVLLVLDEAQQLSPQLIEEIEAIITLGTQELEGLSVCLVGQLDNADCLKGHILSFFKNHDMVLHHLAPMTQEETANYIQHRLKVAGTTRKIFTDDAVQKIHRHSDGYPTQINNICDLALFIGESKQATDIDAALILANADKLQFSPRQGDSPTNCQVTDAACKDKDQNDDAEISKPDSDAKPDIKQRISALEVFAQLDKDKEKQEPEPKRSFALPTLGLCLLLLLGTSGYVYYHKWIERPDLPQIKPIQVQEKEPKQAISQTSAGNLTPVKGQQAISPPIPSPTQVDSTLSLSQEKTPDKGAVNPNNVSLLEEQPIPTPAPILVESDGDETGVDKLVTPQLQEKEPKQAISQKSASNFTPVKGAQTISPPIPSPTQVDNTLSLPQEKIPDKETGNLNTVSLQEEQPTPTPVSLLVQPDGDETRVDKLVMPQLQEQIQDLLQEATSDLFVEQATPVIEDENQKKVTLLPPEKSLSKTKQEKTLPATLKRSQELQQFLAGGSFAGVKKSDKKKQSDQNEKKSVQLSSPINTKKQPKVEPAPANVIDWLLKKKEQRAP